MTIKELLRDAAVDPQSTPEIKQYLQATVDRMQLVNKPGMVDPGIARHLARAQSHFGRAKMMLESEPSAV